jgi:DNA ligase (NAD+)
MEIKKIVDMLKRASEAYYNTGKQIITDEQFDKLRDHLKSLDPDNDFFKVVGAPVPEHREEVKLIGHMGSQLKVNTEEETRAWFDKYNQPELIVSDKLDGSSVEIVYTDGQLTRAVTRGDGEHGLAVTRNAKLWNGLPHNIDVKGQCVIRGEVQMSIKIYNEHFSDMANPRNTGNGIAICDSGFERNQYLCFHAFDIIHPEVEFKFQSHKFKALENLGFKVARWFSCKTWDELLKCRDHYIKDRFSLDFEIDGMILAINDLKRQEEAGFADGGTRPKGARAWKFLAEKANTKVLKISLTLGQTGKVIPTATVEAVQLAGTTVTHCLLNNFDYIADKNINIGDIVEIQKSGDIIPYITKVITKNTNGPYPPPTDWKGYPLTKEGADWKVTDESCPDLNFQRIRNWINKTGIKYIGDNALEAMVNNGLVKDIDDLYTLDFDQVANLPIGNGVIGSNAKRMSEEIDKTRSMTIDVFMGSLSIKMFGRSRAALLNYSSPQDYVNLNRLDLVGKPCSDNGTYSADVSKQIVESIHNRSDLIFRLSKLLEIKPIELVDSSDGELSGLSFCFSGVRMKPDHKDAFIKLGGVEKKDVKKGLSYLVLKDLNSASNKAVKAEKLGVKVIGYDKFLEMIFK